MKVCILYYDNFCEFEIVLSTILFRGNLETIAIENRVYQSLGKQKFLPDKVISEVDPNTIDLLIIPGGEPSYLYHNKALKDFILEINKNNKYIAGICGGTELMARYRLFKNKKCTGDSTGIKPNKHYFHLFKDAIILDEDIVKDGNIISSKGQAYVEFAFYLKKLIGDITDEEANDMYKFFKNIK